MNARAANRYVVAIIGLLFVAAIAAVAATVRFWLDPWQPLAVFVVFGVGPLLFWAMVGSLVFDPSKATDGVVASDAPPLGERVKISLVPILVGALGFGGILCSWFSPAVRVEALEISTEQRLVGTLEEALRDPDDGVRMAACEGIRDVGSEISALVLIDRLGDQSEEVVDCALQSLPNTHGNAPYPVRVAAGGWFRELMDASQGELEGDRACQLTERLRAAERVGVDFAPVLLLECAVGANSVPARECCSQSFRGTLGADGEPPMVLPSLATLAKTEFVAHIPALLQNTFGAEAHHEQVRQSLRLEGVRTAAWTLAAGCEALQTAGAQWREPVSSAIASVVSDDQCQIPPATEGTVRLWTAVCSEVLGPTDVELADGGEGERLCVGIRRAIAADAVNEARYASLRALRAAREPDRRFEMMRALLDYSKASRVRRASPEAKNIALGTRESPIGEGRRHLFGAVLGRARSESRPAHHDQVFEAMEDFVRTGKGPANASSPQ